ncbi:hypothetical protein Ciccas_010871 [Cichlidogyrus casuarinus]|uniref:Uncharacterized protein n=1 Tax=Cichlidogyrus casuarinus TaxID=1844966 RepID=A0ABD2PSW6_9PLAT
MQTEGDYQMEAQSRYTRPQMEQAVGALPQIHMKHVSIEAFINRSPKETVRRDCKDKTEQTVDKCMRECGFQTDDEEPIVEELKQTTIQTGTRTSCRDSHCQVAMQVGRQDRAEQTLTPNQCDLMTQTDSPMVLTNCSTGVTIRLEEQQSQQDIGFLETYTQTRIAEMKDVFCEVLLKSRELCNPGISFVYTDARVQSTQVHRASKEESCQVVQQGRPSLDCETMTQLDTREAQLETRNCSTETRQVTEETNQTVQCKPKCSDSHSQVEVAIPETRDGSCHTESEIVPETMDALTYLYESEPVQLETSSRHIDSPSGIMKDRQVQMQVEKSTLEFASQYQPAVLDTITAAVQCEPKCRESYTETSDATQKLMNTSSKYSTQTMNQSLAAGRQRTVVDLAVAAHGFDMIESGTTYTSPKLKFEEVTCQTALPAHHIASSFIYTASCSPEKRHQICQSTPTIRMTEAMVCSGVQDLKDASQQTLEFASQFQLKSRDSHCQTATLPTFEISCETDRDSCQIASSFVYTKVSHLATECVTVNDPGSQFQCPSSTKDESCQVTELAGLREAMCYSYDTMNQVLHAPSTRFTRLSDELLERPTNHSPSERNSTLHTDMFSTESSTTSMDFEWQETDLPLVFDDSLQKEFSTQTDSPSNINLNGIGFQDIITSLNHTEKQGLYKILCQAFDRGSSQDLLLNQFLNELIMHNPDVSENFTSEIGVNVCSLSSNKSQCVTANLLPDNWDNQPKYSDRYKMGIIVECECQTNPLVQHSVSSQSYILVSHVANQTGVKMCDGTVQTVAHAERMADQVQEIDLDCEIEVNLEDLVEQQVSVSYEPVDTALATSFQPSISSDQVKITVNCRQLMYQLTEHVVPSSTLFLTDIASVYNPISRTFLPTEQAIGRGLLKIGDTISYFDRTSKSTISLEHALLLGRVKLNSSKYTVASPDRRTVGLILVERENIVKRSALLDFVIDTETKKKIPARVAMRNGWIKENTHSIQVLDTRTKSYINIEEAIGNGLAQVSEPFDDKQDVILRSLVKLFHVTRVSADGIDFHDLEEAMRLGYFNWQTGKVATGATTWDSLLDSLKKGRAEMVEAVGLSLNDVGRECRDILHKTDLISFDEMSRGDRGGTTERRRYFCYEKHVIQRVTQRYTEEHVFEASESRIYK